MGAHNVHHGSSACAGRGGLSNTSDSAVEFPLHSGDVCRRTRVVCSEVSSSWRRAVASPAQSPAFICILSEISHVVVLSSEKSLVPGLWATHPVHVKAEKVLYPEMPK